MRPGRMFPPPAFVPLSRTVGLGLGVGSTPSDAWDATPQRQSAKMYHPCTGSVQGQLCALTAALQPSPLAHGLHTWRDVQPAFRLLPTREDSCLTIPHLVDPHPDPSSFLSYPTLSVTRGETGGQHNCLGPACVSKSYPPLPQCYPLTSGPFTSKTTQKVGHKNPHHGHKQGRMVVGCR